MAECSNFHQTAVLWLDISHNFTVKDRTPQHAYACIVLLFSSLFNLKHKSALDNFHLFVNVFICVKLLKFYTRKDGSAAILQSINQEE